MARLLLGQESLPAGDDTGETAVWGAITVDSLGRSLPESLVRPPRLIQTGKLAPDASLAQGIGPVVLLCCGLPLEGLLMQRSWGDQIVQMEGLSADQRVQLAAMTCGGIAYISNLAVAVDMRRRGLGLELLHAAEQAMPPAPASRPPP